MIDKQNDLLFEFEKIKYHLLKIDALYAALIKESLDMMSMFKDTEIFMPLKLLSQKHVFLEQIAAHRVVVSAIGKCLPHGKFNYYKLRKTCFSGELIEIDTLMRCISEKIGFMIGMDNKSKEILAQFNLSAKWHYRMLLEHKKEQESYFRRPLWYIM